jgi:hypothetical protein
VVRVRGRMQSSGLTHLVGPCGSASAITVAENFGRLFAQDNYAVAGLIMLYRRQACWGYFTFAHKTFRMAKAAGASNLRAAQGGRAVGVQHATFCGCGKIMHDVIGAVRITGNSADPCLRGTEVVEAECVADAPRDSVIGAGGIAAHADGANFYAALAKQRKSAAKEIHPANPQAHQWVMGGAESLRIALVCDVRIDKIAMLEPIESSARLHGRK